MAAFGAALPKHGTYAIIFITVISIFKAHALRRGFPGRSAYSQLINRLNLKASQYWLFRQPYLFICWSRIIVGNNSPEFKYTDHWCKVIDLIACDLLEVELAVHRPTLTNWLLLWSQWNWNQFELNIWMKWTLIEHWSELDWTWTSIEHKLRTWSNWTWIAIRIYFNLIALNWNWTCIELELNLHWTCIELELKLYLHWFYFVFALILFLYLILMSAASKTATYH